jgi:hypothetical protein
MFVTQQTITIKDNNDKFKDIFQQSEGLFKEIKKFQPQTVSLTT